MIEHETTGGAEVQAVMRRLAQSGAAMAPVMGVIAGIMQDAVEENFEQEGRPKWAGLKAPVNPRRVGGKILQDRGHLANSFVQRHDATSATVGTNVIYARIQNDGGQTGPHEIRPRYAKALAFNGRVVKKVNHPGSKIPARPFMLLTPGDEAEIVHAVSDYLSKIIG
ncbi:MAG: phage capsid and scaffold [Rhodocyclales bacterium]|nr:phage capsid and scaffold [Rhodocyclales bacterium]